MEEREFVAGSKDAWERLASALSDTRGRGVTSLGPERLKRMHEDYRRSAADLAYAQTHYPASPTVRYLNGLVGRAHGEIYSSSPRRLARVWRFLSRDYPRIVRANAGPMLLSATILTASIALGYLLVFANYPLARLFLPADFREGVGDALQRTGDLEAIAGQAPLFSAFITVNNVQVSLLAFAGGMTFGGLTVYALVMNGLLLGALAGVFEQGGASLHFWSLIVPHGALELPAIALAGGAGLMLARALLRPGDLPRAAALRAAAPDATRAVLGVVPLLMIAGFIEGFLTPRGIDPVLKMAVGAVAGLAFLAYVGLAGRNAEKADR
ncbi:MAG: stage II sporulation protein M [Coriobacteriia bacterium]|nr:stage II sporulation protein M [Coriobacteriia bacterium]